jgi:riboflavin-specific deaminase-like protein
MPDALGELSEWLSGAPRPPTRPLVTVSYAQSLDGSIAAPGGGTLRLSGPQSMRMTHVLRSLHDSIMVGIGTVLADDPQLTVREVEGENPRPFVVDTHLRTPVSARVLSSGKPPVIAAAESADASAQVALEKAGAEVVRVPTSPDGWLQLTSLLSRLESFGVTRLMVEGGARLVTSFLNARLVDRVVITVSPCLVGGLKAVGIIDLAQFGHYPRLVQPHSACFGEDIVIWGDVESPSR